MFAPTTTDPAPAPARWHREVAAEPVVVPELRRGVAEFARAHRADDDAVSNIMLAVSEAVTNAIVHAFVDRERGRVSITAEAGEDCVLVSVRDDGRGMTPDPESPGLGLGLTMMASMTTRCDIRQGPAGRGTEVRMAFAAPGVAGPALAIGEGDDRFELLMAVERLADDAGWPGEGVDQLVALIVPRIADACTLDIIDGSGEPRRLAAHYEGSGGPELAALLAAAGPRASRSTSPSRRIDRATRASSPSTPTPCARSPTTMPRPSDSRPWNLPTG